MNITSFQKKVLSWYAQHKRDLPWRKTKDPYAILISEVMLQQTQVDRVIPYYKRWLTSFPNFSVLARASTHDVLSHWSGLGYNNRALRLKALAQVIVQNYGDAMPMTEEELLSLPGIGPYTARAVLAFAFNKAVAVVDTNVRRVLIFELGLAEDISSKELASIALSCIPSGKSCVWHNALMDYGALKQTARKTGIKSLSSQDRFKGSPRQVRGAITKLLLEKKSLSLAWLHKHFARDDLALIITKMEQDKLLVRTRTGVQLP